MKEVWINVNERTPEDSRSVLIYSEEGGIAEGSYSAKDNKFLQFRWSCYPKVTHWREFPNVTKVKQ